MASEKIENHNCTPTMYCFNTVCVQNKSQLTCKDCSSQHKSHQEYIVDMSTISQQVQTIMNTRKAEIQEQIKRVVDPRFLEVLFRQTLNLKALASKFPDILKTNCSQLYYFLFFSKVQQCVKGEDLRQIFSLFDVQSHTEAQREFFQSPSETDRDGNFDEEGGKQQQDVQTSAVKKIQITLRDPFVFNNEQYQRYNDKIFQFLGDLQQSYEENIQMIQVMQQKVQAQKTLNQPPPASTPTSASSMLDLIEKTISNGLQRERPKQDQFNDFFQNKPQKKMNKPIDSYEILTNKSNYSSSHIINNSSISNRTRFQLPSGNPNQLHEFSKSGLFEDAKVSNQNGLKNKLDSFSKSSSTFDPFQAIFNQKSSSNSSMIERFQTYRKPSSTQSTAHSSNSASSYSLSSNPHLKQFEHPPQYDEKIIIHTKPPSKQINDPRQKGAALFELFADDPQDIQIDDHKDDKFQLLNQLPKEEQKPIEPRKKGAALFQQFADESDEQSQQTSVNKVNEETITKKSSNSQIESKAQSYPLIQNVTKKNQQKVKQKQKSSSSESDEQYTAGGSGGQNNNNNTNNNQNSEEEHTNDDQETDPDFIKENGSPAENRKGDKNSYTQDFQIKVVAYALMVQNFAHAARKYEVRKDYVYQWKTNLYEKQETREHLQMILDKMNEKYGGVFKDGDTTQTNFDQDIEKLQLTSIQSKSKQPESRQVQNGNKEESEEDSKEWTEQIQKFHQKEQQKSSAEEE